MDRSVLNTLCKVIYSCVISVTKSLLDTKILQSSLASSNVPLLRLLLLWSQVINVEFVDSLVALVALLLDFVVIPCFLIVLPAALLDCVMETRPFISIDQFKKNLIGKLEEINTRQSFSANRRWNATHIPLCVWCSLFPTSSASFDETIDCSPCPLWWNHW